ncbi:hypothetical protein J6590_050896 [Homalodisca vitripennis]|nr:hypothetical protein J6590_050896 [Homalodisca vitripennis]
MNVNGLHWRIPLLGNQHDSPRQEANMLIASDHLLMLYLALCFVLPSCHLRPELPRQTAQDTYLSVSPQMVYVSTMNGLKTIVKEEGFRGWWKGLTPTLLQIGPLSGLQFAIFHFLKRKLNDVEWLGDKGSLTVSGTMVAGSVSGFTAKIITYPMDLSRKRLQLQGFQRARIGFGKNFLCSSLTTCLSETVKEEKLLGLFKGLMPSLLKASIVNALIFTFYEKTHSILCDLYEIPK